MSDDLHRSLGRVEGKLDLLITQLQEHREEVSKFDNRLTEVEQHVALSKKVAGAVGAVSAGAVTVVVAAFDPITKWFSK